MNELPQTSINETSIDQDIRFLFCDMLIRNVAQNY